MVSGGITINKDYTIRLKAGRGGPQVRRAGQGGGDKPTEECVLGFIHLDLQRSLPVSSFKVQVHILKPLKSCCCKRGGGSVFQSVVFRVA